MNDRDALPAGHPVGCYCDGCNPDFHPQSCPCGGMVRLGKEREGDACWPHQRDRVAGLSVTAQRGTGMKVLKQGLAEALTCLGGRGGGCSHPATEPHTCPFREEISDDYETMCRCCGVCQRECAYDV